MPKEHAPNPPKPVRVTMEDGLEDEYEAWQRAEIDDRFDRLVGRVKVSNWVEPEVSQDTLRYNTCAIEIETRRWLDPEAEVHSTRYNPTAGQGVVLTIRRTDGRSKLNTMRIRISGTSLEATGLDKFVEFLAEIDKEKQAAKEQAYADVSSLFLDDDDDDDDDYDD